MRLERSLMLTSACSAKRWRVTRRSSRARTASRRRGPSCSRSSAARPRSSPTSPAVGGRPRPRGSRPRSAAGIRPRKGRRKHERDTGPQGVRRALRRRRAAGGTMSAPGPALLLAGDVGATKTNLALFTTAGGVLTSVAEANFVNGGYGGLEDVVRAFLARGASAPTAACFGVAGPVAEGRARMPNLGWLIDAASLGRLFALERVVLLNDLEATAYGIAVLPPEQLVVLNPGVPRPGGNAALIAAGTGLGEAVLYWDGTRHRVSASEAGHADFAPRDVEQIAILGRLMERFGHVSWERVVSGPGLHNIYAALAVAEAPEVAARIAAAEDASATITELGLAGASARCTRALDVFVSAYGAEAGNLALRALATGGVHVGGGIAPKIVGKLADGTFMRAFTAKGRFADWLGRIPVKVILDPKTALRGAAAYLASVEARS